MAQLLGLLPERSRAAIDATGLESRHVSRYYVWRRGSRRHPRFRWPKITVVCDLASHLLTGAFICSKTIAPGMVAAGWGRIIHISSVQGKEGTAQAGAYAASKAGLIAFGKTLGKELAATGVTVNCITPTVIETGMIREISEQRREDLLARIPMGRFSRATEVAAMVAWIASEECSFSTGAVFDMSGGRATW